MAGLSRDAIVEYQEIYKKVYGKDISYEQALEQGTKLLRLFEIIYHPVPKEWREKLQSDKIIKKTKKI